MTKIEFYRSDDGLAIGEAAIELGQSVMEVAVRDGIAGIVAECGGAMSCATCHVFMDAEDQRYFEAKEDMEAEMLAELSEVHTSESRLSCQLLLISETAAIKVRVPSKQGF